MSMQLVQRITLASNSSAIVFNNVPQDATDLLLLCSLRSTRSGNTISNAKVGFNSSTTGYAFNVLLARGTSIIASAGTGGTDGVLGWSVPGGGATANSFGNVSIYIPNYTSSSPKTISTDETYADNTGNSIDLQLHAGSWSAPDPITSIQFGLRSADAAEYVAGSSVSLYKITRGSTPGITVS